MIDETDLGLVYAHLLYHGQETSVTADGMTTELESHGYEYDNEEIEHGLRNLVAKGLMDTDETEFWTTDQGEAFLTEMKQKLAEAHDEIR